MFQNPSENYDLNIYMIKILSKVLLTKCGELFTSKLQLQSGGDK